MTKNLRRMTPVEIDTILAENWQSQANVSGYLHSLRRPTRWQVTRSRAAEDNAVQIAQYEAKLSDLRSEAAPYEKEYARRPWRRYFLVTNGNGHVHRGMDCPTCYPTTHYAWLIDLADCDEAEMVTEYGEKACTVCFPDAPTNPAYHGPGRRDREAAEARAAEKAAKDADRAAKAITDVDGRPLRVGSDIIRTKVGAQRALSQAVQNFGWYGGFHPEDFGGQIRQLSAALRAAGIDPEPIIARAVAKAEKEGADHKWTEPAY